MNPEITAQELIARIKLPEQDLTSLSFCNGTKASKVKAWAESLPATRMSHTSVLLYKILPELCHIKTGSDNRLQMLESIRPYVQQCIQGLSQDFLNQPLILPKNALKTATVAQALQKHMTAGYTLVIKDSAVKLKNGKRPQYQKLALPLHRAITGLGLLLLRSFQLYAPVPAQLWFEVHTLYRIAKIYDLLPTSIADPLLVFTNACSIERAYLRVLMLACSRPNQLTQNELAAIYAALEDWASLVELKTTDEQNRNNLFIVNLSVDMPPMYKSRFRGSLNDTTYELDTCGLLATLKKNREGGSEGIIQVPQEMTHTLQEHLIGAWEVLRQRNFERRITNGDLEVTVGISNLHFHITDGAPFDSFLVNPQQHTPHKNDTLLNNTDDFYSHLPNTTTAQRESRGAGGESSQQQEHPVFRVRILDASPGGYCLDWRDEIPVQIRAGELIGIREAGRHKWGVCIVRWLRQNLGATQLGVQIRAPMATPYAASMVHNTGTSSEYMRVLMLPELKAIGQPTSLLTAAVPFQEYSKVKLNQYGDEQMIQLTHRFFATGSIHQFKFRLLETNQKPSNDKGSGSYTSAWKGV